MKIKNKKSVSTDSATITTGMTAEIAVKKKTPIWEKLVIVFLSVIIVACLLCVAIVFLFNTKLFNDKNSTFGSLENETQAVSTKETSPTVSKPTVIKSAVTNFLICGIDYAQGSGRGKLTDVIMVASFDKDGKRVNILQIPRDTYIGDDYNTGKINAIYGHKTNGGIDGLAKRISEMFKISIDHYVTINMDGFINAVDQIGGIEIDVPQQINLEGVTLNSGLQTLNGKQAEIFVRERKSYSNGDLGRMNMQKVFMEALIEKMFSLNPAEIAALAGSLVKEVTTDLTVAQMLSYYADLNDIDKNSDISFHNLPTASANKNGLFVFSINKPETADLLNTYFRPYSEHVKAEDLNMIIDVIVN